MQQTFLEPYFDLIWSIQRITGSKNLVRKDTDIMMHSVQFSITKQTTWSTDEDSVSNHCSVEVALSKIVM